MHKLHYMVQYTTKVTHEQKWVCNHVNYNRPQKLTQAVTRENPSGQKRYKERGIWEV